MSSERLTRRELLARGAGAVVAAGAAAAGGYLLYDPEGNGGLCRQSGTARPIKNFFAQVDFPTASPRISVATGDERRIEQMVRAAVGGLDPGLGMRRFVKQGDVVLIKPNVGFDRPPRLGATTHPEVLRWVIRLCREAGARKVIIADNPIEAPEACFAKSGIGPMADAEGAQIVLPAESRFEMVPVGHAVLVAAGETPAATFAGEACGHGPGLPDRWPVLYQPLAEATKVIGVAPTKDHNLCSASMNLKNWYGLLGGRRNQLHQAIHEVISALAVLISPTLVIADATRVMMRNGPTGGRASDVEPGGQFGRPTVVAAVDPVACDAWCYEKLLGRDRARLAYLDLAHRKIQARVAAGDQRLGDSDWQSYARQGRIVTTSV